MEQQHISTLMMANCALVHQLRRLQTPLLGL